MNKLKEHLTEIFNSEVIEENFFNNEEKNNRVILLEEQENPDTLSEMTLIGFDEIYFVVNYDKLPFLHGRADSCSNVEPSLLMLDNIRKACDYIIWAKLDGVNVLLLIELKSNNNGSVGAKFKNTKAFITYLNSILNEYFEFRVEEFDFSLIPILINTKSSKRITKNDKFFHKSMGSRREYYIKQDVEKLLS